MPHIADGVLHELWQNVENGIVHPRLGDMAHRIAKEEVERIVLERVRAAIERHATIADVYNSEEPARAPRLTPPPSQPSSPIKGGEPGRQGKTQTRPSPSRPLLQSSPSKGFHPPTRKPPAISANKLQPWTPAKTNLKAGVGSPEDNSRSLNNLPAMNHYISSPALPLASPLKSTYYPPHVRANAQPGPSGCQNPSFPNQPKYEIIDVDMVDIGGGGNSVPANDGDATSEFADFDLY
jgi:hypothetical protein